MPEPRWHPVRCLDCGGTAKLYTATGPKGSPCYFCGAKALVEWDGKAADEVKPEGGSEHLCDTYGYMLAALKLKTHYAPAPTPEQVTAWGAKFEALGHPPDPDAWFRDALRGMGLG